MSRLAQIGNDVTDMHTRIPESIRPILREYLQLMEKELPGFLIGFYLHGSLALEAFNDDWSDIDFIALVNRKCVADDIGHLKIIHAQVSKKYPRWDLSGSYLQLNDLGQTDESVAPVPCHHEGVVSPNGHPDAGLVTWWVLKNRGIALIGDEPGDLPFTVD